jgi:two-component system, NtrC family, nitrogen regulation sensor histidine kinase NtrY
MSSTLALALVIVTVLSLIVAAISARRALRVNVARRDAAEREKLLATLVDAAPMAIVLFGDEGDIVYTNDEARDLFFEGRSVEGGNFLALLGGAPEPIRKALLADRDELFTIEADDGSETYHLSKRRFELRGHPHTLLMVKHLTQELNRQEVDVWKRMIRVISHELNNSLAPISSLAHSARRIAEGVAAPTKAKLERVFDTVAERADHLRDFLEGYARFARLPAPRLSRVEWTPFLDGVRVSFPHIRVTGPRAIAGWFDAGQIQQVLINLIKNAEEAGSARAAIEVVVEGEEDAGGVALTVRDRGKGMSDDTLRHALLPFYSTKERGTGLGLALCREIAEAHGGRLRIRGRAGGGVEVVLRLPGRTSLGSSRVRLTLTKG